MKILQRYVQQEFLKIFAVCFSALLGTYFLVDFFQRIDLFVKYKAPFHYLFAYFALKVPLFVYHIAPIAVLVSALVSLGILNRNSEITAMRASGVMLLRICYPLVVWGFLISVLVFVNNEFIAPHTSKRARYIKNHLIKKRPVRSVFLQNHIWYYGENSTIFNIQHLEPAKRTMEGVTLYRFDTNHSRLTERIDATRAVFDKGRWIFENGTVRTFPAKGGVKVNSFPEKEINLPESPEDLSQFRENPDEMNFISLAEYVRKLNRSGFNPTAYVVDLYSKTSIPLISLVISILSIPFAFRARPSGGIVASLGMSLVLGFAYWVLISIFVALGHAGKVPPFLSAWAPNIFFLAVGAYLWIHLE